MCSTWSLQWRKPHESFFFFLQDVNRTLIHASRLGRQHEDDWLAASYQFPTWSHGAIVGCLNLAALLDIYQVKLWDKGNRNVKLSTLWNWNGCRVNTLPYSDFYFDHQAGFHDGHNGWRACYEAVYFFSMKPIVFTYSKMVFTRKWFTHKYEHKNPSHQWFTCQAVSVSGILLSSWPSNVKRSCHLWNQLCLFPTCSGLNSIPYVHLQPQNMTLFGNKVFADDIR